MNAYGHTVEQLAANLHTTIRQLRRDGTIAMSYDNLLQIVSMRGLSFANPYMRERAFGDAVALVAPKLRWFQIVVRS